MTTTRTNTKAQIQARVEELETAIRKHMDEFPDEPLDGEFELWAHLGDEARTE